MEAKRGFIEAFFDDLNERLKFTRELSDSSHRQEAMLLCCCYIDGLANELYLDDRSSHRSFVRAIKEYGGTEFLTRIHLRQLKESLERMRNPPREVLELLDACFPEIPQELLSDEQLMASVEGLADQRTSERLRSEVWRGTLASVAYTHLRVPSVHGLGGPGGIVFDDSRIDGQPVPSIDYEVLYNVATRINEAAKTISLETNSWFGHDFSQHVDPAW